MELVIDGVDVFNPINGKLDIVRDCFIEFYGEKYRDRITTNFNNATFIFTPRFKDQISYIDVSKVLEEVLHKKEIEILSEKYNFNEEKLNMLSRLSGVSGAKFLLRQIDSMDEEGVHEMYCAHGYMQEALMLTGYSKTFNEMVADRIKELGRKPTEFDIQKFKMNAGLRSEQIMEIMKHPETRNQVRNFLKDFLKYRNGDAFNSYNEMIKRVEDIKSRIFNIEKSIYDIEQSANQKINLEIYKKFSEYVETKEDYSKISSKARYHVNTMRKLIEIGKENLLDDLSISDNMKVDAVELFKYLGFSFGDNYRNYVKNRELINGLFDDDILNKVREIKIEALKKQIGIRPNVYNNVLKISSLDSSIGTHELVESYLNYEFANDNTGAFVYDFDSSSDDDIHSICVCSWAIDGQDGYIVHELGHIATMSVVESNDYCYTSKNGVEVIVKDKDDIHEFSYDNLNLPKDEDNVKRENEIINEVINDYFSRKVFYKIKQKGINFNFGEQDEYSKTGYACCFGLIENLLEKYESEFKECMMNSDPETIETLMGEKNFCALSQLLNRYYEELNSPEGVTFRTELKFKCNVTGKTEREVMMTTGDWDVDESRYLEIWQNFLRLEKKIDKAISQKISSEEWGQ